jgi:hypothetical protein
MIREFKTFMPRKSELGVRFRFTMRVLDAAAHDRTFQVVSVPEAYRSQVLERNRMVFYKAIL